MKRPPLHPMTEFAPSQPAMLHHRVTDRIETRTADHAADFVNVRSPSRTVPLNGHRFIFDGWDNLLGG